MTATTTKHTSAGLWIGTVNMAGDGRLRLRLGSLEGTNVGTASFFLVDTALVRRDTTPPEGDERIG